MRYLSANAQHVGAREYQQDFFGLAGPEHAQMEPGQRLADPQFAAHAGFLAVLCDGMGGMAHGDVASKTAVQSMLRAYARKTPQESIPDALERSVREANQQVLIAANDLGMPEAVGTTLVAAVLHTAPEGQEFLYFASVGDSGLFHVTGGVSGGLGGGQLHTVNQPHVYANVLDRAVANGAISQQQAEQHPERESLTSFVGIQNLTEIDRNTEPWPVAAGDTILLASDGMFKTLEAHEIAAALDGDPRRWPQTLVDQVLAKQRPGQDNVTVVSVTLDNGWFAPLEVPAASVFQDGQPSLADLSAASSTPSRFLMLAILFLIVALGLAGLWFFHARR